MGFFTSLFGRSDAEDEIENFVNEISEGQLPELNNGMTLNLETPDGRHILAGRLSGYSAGDGALTLERLPGGLSLKLCETGTSVTVRGAGGSMMQFVLMGTVQESTRMVCRLKNVKFKLVSENRRNLRLQVSLPATLYYREDEALRRPEECALVDISTGGACIESEYLHAVDEVLRLKVKLLDYAPMEYIGEIIRVEEYEPKKFRYGFLFAQLNSRELADLTRTLHNIQSGNYTTWQRTGAGHWGPSRKDE